MRIKSWRRSCNSIHRHFNWLAHPNLPSVNSENGESVGPGSITVNASNGDLFATAVHGNGKNITVASSHDIMLEEGITNVSKNELHNFVSVYAGRNINIPDGIINNNLVGEGGIVDVFAQQASGLNIGGSGLRIENDSATHGGTVQIGNVGSLNIGAGGISSKAANGNGSSILLQTYATESGPSALNIGTPLDMADAGVEGNGGEIRIYAEGPLTFSGTQFSANGAGTGRGGYISIRTDHKFNAQNATLMANGGSDGSGGNIEIYAPEFTGGNFNLFANGNGTGVGGYNFLSLTEATSASSGQIAMTATGANGGIATITAAGDLQVDTSVFNVSPLSTEEGYGNGGTVSLESQSGSLSISGNINVDGIGTGRGGEIYLRSGGPDELLVNAQTKLFARGGSTGSADGSGGRIELRGGGDVTINADAVLNVSPRGENGSGGVISISAGDFFGPSSPSLLTVNRTLLANGKGTGDGGTIILSSSGGKENSGIILNGALQANSGLLGNSGGIIRLQMWGINGLGDILVNSNLSANAGEIGQGGQINIGLLGSFVGSGPSNLVIASKSNVNALGGTAGGFGGNVTVQGGGRVSVDGSINVSARGIGDAGNITIESMPSSETELEPSIDIAGSLHADAATSGTGGIIKITGDDTQINIKSGTTVTARGGSASGVGGEIRGLSDTAIVVDDATLDASGRGTTADGGLVSIQLRDVSLSEGPVETFALMQSGEPTPAPGEPVSITSSGSLEIRLTGSSIKANAGTEGSGGDVIVKAEGSLKTVNIQPDTSITADGGSNAGSGGSVEIKADDMVVAHADKISASARGDGFGGDITISSSQQSVDVSTDLLANGKASGTGGEINILGTENVSISDSNLYVRFGNGTGGKVNVTAGKDLAVSETRLNASPENGNGGTITLTSGLAGEGKLGFSGTMIADGEGNGGDGGTIEATALSGSATFDHPAFSADFASVTGGALAEHGNGGSLTLAAADDLLMNSGRVTASSLASSGNGGTITLLAGQQGSGRLSYNFELLANGGSKSGTGGNITMGQSSDAPMSVAGMLTSQSRGSNPPSVITLQNTSKQNFQLDISGTQKVSGGGTVIVKNAGSLVELNVSGNVDLGRTSENDLGTLSLKGLEGSKVKISAASTGSINAALVVESQSFDADVSGKLIVDSVKASNGDVKIASDSFILVLEGTLEGQNISIEAKDTAGELRISTGALVTAKGSSESTGSIKIQGRGNIDIQVGSTLKANNLDESKIGGTIVINALGDLSTLRLNGVLDVSGSLSGGQIAIETHNSNEISVNGSLIADSLKVGEAGSAISIFNNSPSQLLSVRVGKNAYISAYSEENTGSSFSISGSADVNLQVAPDALLRAPVSLRGQAIEANFLADRLVVVDEIHASKSLLLTMGKDSELLVPQGSLIHAEDRLEIFTSKLTNNGTIESVSPDQDIFADIFLHGRQNGFTLINNGTIDARNAANNLTSRLAIVADRRDLNIDGHGKIFANNIQFTAYDIYHHSGNQQVTQYSAPSAQSVVLIEADGVVIDNNANLSFKSQSPLMPLSSVGITTAFLHNNGTLDTPTAVAVNPRKSVAGDTAVLHFDSTGTWFVSSISLDLKGLVEKSSVVGNMGYLVGPNDTSAAIYFPDNLALGRVNLQFTGGAIDFHGLHSADSVSLAMLAPTGHHSIILSGNITSFGRILVQNHSVEGSIVVSKDVQLIATQRLELSVGKVVPSVRLTNPPANVTITGSLGPDILISPKIPDFSGAVTQIYNPNPRGNEKMVIYDGGALPQKQIVIHGGNGFYLPISYHSGSSLAHPRLYQAEASNVMLWFFETPTITTEKDGCLVLENSEMLFLALENLRMNTNEGSISVKKGAVVSVSKANNSLVIRNLADRHARSLIFRNKHHCLEIPVGFQLQIGEDLLNLPTRDSVKLNMSTSKKCFVSEFSQYSMLKTELLQSFLSVKDAHVQEISSWLKKSVVCANLVRSKKGPFQQR